VILWLFGTLLTVGAAYVFASVVYPTTDQPHDRWCATAVLGLGGAIGETRLLGAFHGVRPMVLLVMIVAVALGAAAVALRRGTWALARHDSERIRSVVQASFRRDFLWLGWLAGALGLGLPALAAWLLHVWSWDSLGYHLPIVYDALQTGTIRQIPAYERYDYINCYPRNIEYFFLWSRLLLPNDTWLDFSQAPFAVATVVAVACWMRRLGVAGFRAAPIACFFLTIPIVSLQLATNYVDVGYAGLLVLSFYFATGPFTKESLLLFGIAAGVALSSKPSAPAALAIMCLYVLGRGIYTKRPLLATGGVALCLALGSGKYLENIYRFGNPAWPVRLNFGPFHLPGQDTPQELVLLGVPKSFASMNFFHRVFTSWTSHPTRYIYDMRLGGFGDWFVWILVPAFFLGCWDPRTRRAAAVLLVGIVATMATPGAFWARYCLAVPALLLVLFGVVSHQWPLRWQKFSYLTLGAMALAGLVQQAYPGFTNYGPSLLSLVPASPLDRMRAVSLDDIEDRWHALRWSLAPGDTLAYDKSFALPGQLWRSDGQTRVMYFDANKFADVDELLAWMRREKVRAAALENAPSAMATMIQQRPEAFSFLFACVKETDSSCRVYRINDDSALQKSSPSTRNSPSSDSPSTGTAASPPDK